MAELLQPPADIYEVDHELTLHKMRVPYKRTTTVENQKPYSMGIVFASPGQELTIVYGNAALNHLRFNEPSNRMGMKIAALVMDRMSKTKTSDTTTTDNTPSKNTPSKNKGGRDAERIPFEEVYKKISNELAEAAYMHIEAHQNRRLSFAFQVMKGFNTDDNGNVWLDKILLEYARIRLGFTPKHIDEFCAGLKAIFTVFLSTVPKLHSVTGHGSWALPILHMLNDHMRFRRVTPIAFHTDEQTDLQKGVPQRDSHNQLVYFNGVHCLVENRKSVIKELQNFAAKFTTTKLHPLPKPDEETEDGNPGTEPPPKKRPRRVLDFGGRSP